MKSGPLSPHATPTIFFFSTFKIRTLIISVFNVAVCQMARLGFYLPTTRSRGAGIQTHVTSVSVFAPTRDLLKDALPTEQPPRGISVTTSDSSCGEFLGHGG